MKLLKNLNFLLLLGLLVMSSCGDDPVIIDPVEIEEVLINASINGTVINEVGFPMPLIPVRLGLNTSVTDENGFFSFNNVMMNQNGALVSVDVDGFFANSKVVFANVDKTSITKIMLIEKTVTTTFDASSGGTATMNGGAKVVLPANGVKLESGGVYTGNVHVYSTWLDPTADDLSLRMPGDLRATDSNNSAVKLATYGMVGVELEGDGGEALNIADGQTATVEFPVPASLRGSAPATIPLWHFDEASGYWVEEGEAILTNGDTYVGTVSHFSFWNVDVPYQFVHIDGSVVDARSNGISGLLIVLSAESNGETGHGYTDSEGSYEGFVPKDETLTITIFDDCDQEVYTGQIGPFSDDAIIPEITISNAAGNFVNVIGVLNDCNSDIESNGYVHIDIEGYPSNYIDVNDDGTFNGTISVCDQLEITVSGISNDPYSQGTETIHDINGIFELNVGTLITCW